MEPDYGDSIGYWSDRWIGDTPLNQKFPALFALESSKNVVIADCIEVTPTGMHWTWRWKSFLSSLVEANEFNALLNLIRDVKIISLEDKWKWDEGDRNFSIQHIKSLCFKAQNKVPNFPFPWNNWVPKKVNILCWRIEQNRVPTVDNLLKRQLQVNSSICKLCGEEAESSHHLFIGCRISSMI
ncbi:hypothetical protein E3N88_32438 [Mikania micrantha]|uniref:Reverse transcriptase zinc-binding domain-containing protein n=1 Tax=Mikania micrantha TaxID=192012 RepID=A0A5N6MB40_9ASTR|nr:hypothetical protein E3N88_32438 [Mikania micrantha]